MFSNISIISNIPPFIIILCVLFIIGLVFGIIIWVYKSRITKKKVAKIEEIHANANKIYQLFDKERKKESTPDEKYTKH